MSEKVLDRGLHVIYDGGCGFCISSLDWVKKFDPNHRLKFYDFHDHEQIAENFPMLSLHDANDAMFVVDSKGNVYRGFFAFRKIVAALPLLTAAMPFFYFPGASWAGPKAYAWVARNRHKLGCKSGVCKI